MQALVAVIAELSRQVARLDEQVSESLGQHPDAEIYRSQPGLGPVLAARVLAEFGDDPDHYADAKSRKNYSGMSPITRASGTWRVVLARCARNRWLARRPGSAGLRRPSPASPGARHYYDAHRSRGATQATAWPPVEINNQREVDAA